MAISVLTWVWDYSQSRHGSRLVLLAIADSMNNEHGWAWPSVKELVRKTALKERGVQAAIADLVKLGELEVAYNAGPKGCNRYRVLLSTPAESAPPQSLHPAHAAPPQSSQGQESSQVNGQPPAESAPPAGNAGAQNPARTPAESAPGTVKKPKPKNSPTESSSGRRKRATRIPDDFVVTPEMAQWARDNVPELINRGRGKRETDKFVNYWQAKSGKDATKHDWVATWRNWMLKAEESLEPDGSSGTSRVSPRDEWKHNRS
jgi:hypothetical protein